MKLTKRILSIAIERMDDANRDTSLLGSYSNQPKGDYSIDREHSLDCPINNRHVVDPVTDKLERIIRYLDIERLERTENYDTHSGTIADTIGDAQDILISAQDTVAECSCGKSGDRGRNEMRYFNASENYASEPIANIVQYTKQDYARMESLNAGEWGFIGIGAKARVTVGDICQAVTSGGLWGIESDSDKSYLKEEEQNQLAELRAVLYEMGFSKRAIAAAVKDADL